MAYVAPQNKLSMLSNALSGTAKAMNDFAAVKLKRDEMAQQQSQFNANLDLGFQRLDEQIRKTDMDDATRREMQKLRNDLAKSEGMETRATQERIATQRTSLGYSQLAESTRQFTLQAEQEAREESNISQSLTSFDDIPKLLSPEENPEEFAQKYPGGIEDPLYASDLQQRERMTVEQGNALALQLSPSGIVTAEIRKRARAIVEDKEAYRTRVVTRQQQMSIAKYSGYNTRTSGKRAREYIARTKPAAESAAEWQPVYETAPIYEGYGETGDVAQSTPVQEGDQPAGIMTRPKMGANYNAIEASISNIIDPMQQQQANAAFQQFRSMMNYGDHALKNEKDMLGQKEVRTSMMAAADTLDLSMGNSNMQAHDLAQRFYSFYSDPQRSLEGSLDWQAGRKVPTLTHRPPTRVDIQNKVIGSGADSTTMPDDNYDDEILSLHPEGMSVEDAQKHSDVDAALEEAFRNKGEPLTPIERGQIISEFVEGL